MPDSRFLVLSLASLLLGAVLFLYPKALMKMSSTLNRTMVVLDQQFVRHRYLVGLLAFVASYAFFKLAITMTMVGR